MAGTCRACQVKASRVCVLLLWLLAAMQLPGHASHEVGSAAAAASAACFGSAACVGHPWTPMGLGLRWDHARCTPHLAPKSTQGTSE